MVTVPQKVSEILDETPFYKRLIAQNLLNISEFARQIKPRVEKELIKNVSQASVVMALKRLSNTIRYQSKVNYASHFGDISLKSGLTEFTYRNSSTLYKCIERLLSLASKTESNYISFIKGTWQTTIIASNNLGLDLLRIFKGELLEVEFQNLSSITIQLKNDHIEEPGVIAYMLDQLAVKNVNVVEVVSTFDELTVVVKNNDVDKAFRTMNNVHQQKLTSSR